MLLPPPVVPLVPFVKANVVPSTTAFSLELSTNPLTVKVSDLIVCPVSTVLMLALENIATAAACTLPGEPSVKVGLVDVAVMLGGSFTPVTLIVIVLDDWSRSTPPLPVPPSSCTWNVKLASGEPLALAAGVNTSLPAVIDPTLIHRQSLHATPSSASVPDPAHGSVVIFTASRWLAGLSFVSVKAKLSAVKV